MSAGIGNLNYIIHAVEPTILWPEAKALRTLDAKSVAKFIYENIVCRFACVPFIMMDGGPEFKKEVLFLLSSLYSCTVVISTAYHPEGNAPVEHGHQPIVDTLYKCTGDAKVNWPKYLHTVLFAVRVTVSWATGFSPYYLLYGVHPVFCFDMAEITWQTPDRDNVRTHEELLAICALQINRQDPKLREASEKLRRSRERAIEDLHKRNHFAFDFADYEEGIYVWLRESKLDETKHHIGPE
jgi:hypothetical protein